MIIRESAKIGDKTITLETGRIAKQASGSILLTCGESMILITVVGNEEPRQGVSFMPLTVDYVEKTYAAGKIPGGFFKREGKLRDHEVLTSRIIDRPCRPLFPDGYRCETQIIATVLSADGENPTDVLALTGASAALHISPVPWDGPVAGVRVAYVDGEYIANPTVSELEGSEMDIIVAASKDSITMVEGECDEISEDVLQGAIEFGHEAVQGVLELIEKLREAVGKTKWVHTPKQRDSRIDARVREVALGGVKDACNVREKHPRYAAFKAAKKACVKALAGEFEGQEDDIKAAYEDLRYNTMREQVLYEKKRVDGRDFNTVRPINIEAGLLPRVHGSSLFTRGETQAIVTATLGTRQDEQKIDGLLEQYWKNFILHYNFPPYSVGETKFLRGPGRREVGHGNLAERALKKLMPDADDFPYTVRIVSEITESNGSSSMASVCGGSLALMDAGVPVKAPVAGVAMGMIAKGQDFAILTDILGDEDHLGDMDFKVCGTEKGITAIQMDLKVDGLTSDTMSKALEQAREGRLHILGKMNEILSTHREELSEHAPRITALKVKPDQIRSIIGPGGKMIKAIVDQTGVKIDVEDDGTVKLASSDAESVQKAIAIIEGLTTSPEVGAKYKGTVRRVERYGAFIEIAPGKDGLLHVTDMAWEFVEDVEALMKLGDEVEVVVSNIDREGRIKLSRKPLLPKPEGMSDDDDKPRRPRRDDDRGGRREGRGRDGRGRDGERRPRRRDDEDERPRSRRDRDDEDRPRRRSRDDEDRPRRRDRDDRDGEERSSRRSRDDREGRDGGDREDRPRSRRSRDDEDRPRSRRDRDDEDRPRRRSRDDRDGEDRPRSRRDRDDEDRPRRRSRDDRDGEDRPRSRRDRDEEDRPRRRGRDDRDGEDERPRSRDDRDGDDRDGDDDDRRPRRSRRRRRSSTDRGED